MKNKILIVGLDTAYNKSLAQNLANESGAYFLDIEDYVSYSLFNVHTMKEKCGIYYFNQQEYKSIVSCADYENSVINFPCDLFLRNEMYKFFIESSICVYVKFSELAINKADKNYSDDAKLTTNILCFKEINKQLESICDYTIYVKNKKISTIIKEIISKIVGE